NRAPRRRSARTVGTPRCFLARVQGRPAASGRVWIADPSVPETPNLCFDVLRDIDRFLDALRALHIRHIHLHSLAGYVPEASDFFQKVCEKAQVRYDVTVHDYMAACPRINLIDRSGL